MLLGLFCFHPFLSGRLFVVHLLLFPSMVLKIEIGILTTDRKEYLIHSGPLHLSFSIPRRKERGQGHRAKFRQFAITAILVDLKLRTLVATSSLETVLYNSKFFLLLLFETRSGKKTPKQTPKPTIKTKPKNPQKKTK